MRLRKDLCRRDSDELPLHLVGVKECGVESSRASYVHDVLAAPEGFHVPEHRLQLAVFRHADGDNPAMLYVALAPAGALQRLRLADDGWPIGLCGRGFVCSGLSRRPLCLFRVLCSFGI